MYECLWGSKTSKSCERRRSIILNRCTCNTWCIAVPLAASVWRRNTTCRLDHLGDVVAQLRHGRGHLLGQDVAKGVKGVHLAAHELVAPTDELDELSCVDVWVSTVFDIL